LCHAYALALAIVLISFENSPSIKFKTSKIPVFPEKASSGFMFFRIFGNSKIEVVEVLSEFCLWFLSRKSFSNW